MGTLGVLGRLYSVRKVRNEKIARIFLWIQDAQKQSFMMQTQLGLNACNLKHLDVLCSNYYYRGDNCIVEICGVI